VPGAAALLLAALLVSAPAASAGPRPGERYDGKSGTGEPIFLTVAKDGSRLAHYRFWTKVRCSDGRRRRQGLIDPGERRVGIAADGTFAYTSRAWRGFHRTPRGRVHGRLRLRFTGAFNAAGDAVTGEIRATFRSRRLNCSSGPIAYTMYVDGSPQAPWRDAQMATGIYTARGRGVRLRLRTLAPGRVLVRATISWRTRCARGGRLSGVNSYIHYPLNRERLSRPGHGTRTVAPGVTSTERWRLKLAFSQSAGYRVSGVWTIRAVVRRRGVRIDTCGLSRRFSGSFQRGPG
jgi:hypothetical protein